jgi:CDP-4-dehydro-6-deoxyglucose reductase, E1
MNYKLATSSWDDKEIEALNRVIKSGNFSMGAEVKEFEKQYANYVGSKYCVMVNSGSSANLLAIASLFYTKNPKLKRGDEVIVPAVSWSTSYHPLYQYGLKIKFVDVDIQTLNYDLKQLKAAVTDNTKLILTVDLLGNPNDYDAIAKIIGTRDIEIVEDSCESMGAEYNHKKVGVFGLLGTFSTFFSHHIATMEGGMIVTNNRELYHILISLRAHGWTRGLPKNNEIIELSENQFDEAFNFVLPGYNVRPIEMAGAVGLEQLKKLPSFIQSRRRNAAFFIKLFGNNEHIMIQKEIGKSSWFGFSLIVKDTAPFERNDLIQLFDKNEIECRPIVSGNFTNNSVIKYYDYEIFGKLNNAEKIHHQGIFIGNHPYDISDNLKAVHDVICHLECK